MNKQQWLDKVSHWKEKWPVFLPEYNNDDNGINLYAFLEVLNKNLKDDSCIVSDAGSAIYAPSTNLKLKEGQKFILDGSQAGMGAAIPMSIGVCLARNKQETICITGDGSFNTNIQELAVIKYHQLPIKIFVWNNLGYLSIKNSQLAFYGGRIFGTDSNNGLYFPEISKIAKAYGIQYSKISKIDTNYGDSLIVGIPYVFSRNEPFICEISCDPDQKIQPSLAYKNGKSCPLNDMSPFLSDEEMNEEMIKD